MVCTSGMVSAASKASYTCNGSVMVNSLKWDLNGSFFVCVQRCSLGTSRSITCSLWFPIRPDYIFTPVGCSPLRDRLISTPLRDSRWGLLNILVGLARDNLAHRSNTGSELFSQCCSTELFGSGDKYSTNISNFLWSELRFVLEICQ